MVRRILRRQRGNLQWYRSSHRRCSVRNYVLKNFANFTEKRLRWILLFRLQVCNFIKKGTPTRVFCCQICEIFKNTYFVEHLQTAAFEDSESDESKNDDESYNEGIEAVVRRCS